MIDDVGVDSGEADLSRLVDVVMAGREGLIGSELARLASEGQDGIVLIRALLRRLLLMAQVRADVDRGTSPQLAVERAGRAIFWKDKASIMRDLSRWPSDRLATAIDRIAGAERHLKKSSAVGNVAVDVELFALARVAKRR